uniref:Ribonuclease H-like domain-containing protein n=1 Tax=Tanacetum cinerariifolium TaxID=118510 RepID=A0A699TNR6_TANCI|nr:ribonuclease H-like domain-containing protein [Tanacetum cinerariifolium]
MQIVRGNGGNQFRQYAWQNAGNPAGYNDVIGNQFVLREIQLGKWKPDKTQLLIAQKEDAGIQLQAEEYDLMAAAADLDEIKKVNTNCILMANLQQA